MRGRGKSLYFSVWKAPSADRFQNALSQQKLRIAAHHLKQVIKVVRYPTGQSPYRLHLLGMEKLSFKGLPI